MDILLLLVELPIWFAKRPGGSQLLCAYAHDYFWASLFVGTCCWRYFVSRNVGYHERSSVEMGDFLCPVDEIAFRGFGVLQFQYWASSG